jgi:hypothetical protein
MFPLQSRYPALSRDVAAISGAKVIPNPDAPIGIVLENWSVSNMDRNGIRARMQMRKASSRKKAAEHALELSGSSQDAENFGRSSCHSALADAPIDPPSGNCTVT